MEVKNKDNEMTRNETIDRIIYSLYLEKLFARLSGRVDKFILLVMFVCGSTVVFNFHTTFFGLCIVFLTGIQAKYKFGETSSFSLSQQYKYQRLSALAHKYQDDELLEALLDIEKEDKMPWSILEKPAILLAQKNLNVPKTEQIQLTFYEKFFSVLAGGCVK